MSGAGRANDTDVERQIFSTILIATKVRSSVRLEAQIRASRIAGLKISGLRRRDRCEQRSVRLEVEQRRLVDAIEAAHVDRAAVNSLKQRNRGTDRIGAGGGPQ